MVEAKCIVQGLSVGCKKMQTVVLSIFEVSEHDNQPELEHELLPQYVIDTGEHDGSVCFFRNDILQYETATRNMSSAEDWVLSRIDTSVYSTQHLSSAEDKKFLFCPQLRTQKTYGKQMLLSKLSTMAYLTMVVLP